MESEFLSLVKQRKVQFIVEELALGAEDVSKLQAQLAAADEAGEPRARSSVLSKYWKDVEERGEHTSRTKLSGFVAHDTTNDPILEYGENEDDNSNTIPSPLVKGSAGMGMSSGRGGGNGGGDEVVREMVREAAREVARDEAPFTVPASLTTSSRHEEPMRSSGSYPPSIPPRNGAGSEPMLGRYGSSGASGEGTEQVSSLQQSNERELAELRAQFSGLTYELLKVNAERGSLASSSIQRERDFEELRSEYRKLEIASAEAKKDGLRRRGGGGGGNGNGGGGSMYTKLDEEDDSTTRGGGGDGFALWQLLLLALIAFLLGRISTGL